MSKPKTRNQKTKLTKRARIRHHIRKHKSNFRQWWDKNWWNKLIIIAILGVFIYLASMWAVAEWYIYKHKDEPIKIGATFIPNYARLFDLDPKETFDAITNDLGVKNMRVVSYWKDIEKQKGTYDFSELDWQFEKANNAGVKLSLSIGLRQPRWPECHMPTWADTMSKNEWYPELKKFMTATINRYKDNPALESYQLENEFFMKVFGICPDHSRDRLVDEFNLVKTLDSKTPVIIARSNNWQGLPLGDPRPDMFGISVYKRVWDKAFTHRYFEYPLPAKFYSALAGWGEIFTGRNMMIHELQAEPWLPPDFDMKSSSTEEQYKSMNPERLRNRIEYGVDTGMKRMDLWGVEWWYWRKVQRGDPSLWQTGKEEIFKYNQASY